jgi:hypothetical protein
MCEAEVVVLDEFKALLLLLVGAEEVPFLFSSKDIMDGRRKIE